MKTIIIHSPKYGKFDVLLDDEDFEILGKYKWFITKGKRTFYVVRHTWKNNKQKTHRMHREVLGLTDTDLQGDHISGCGWDNRKSNLRVATHEQNCYNHRPTRGTKYIGVTWRKERKKWEAKIQYNNKSYTIGRFTNIDDAARARDAKAKEMFGEFAYLNLP